MLEHRIAAGASLACALLVSSVFAADVLKSGPPPGEKIPGPFSPLNVTGEDAGQKRCQV